MTFDKAFIEYTQALNLGNDMTNINPHQLIKDFFQFKIFLFIN